MNKMSSTKSLDSGKCAKYPKVIVFILSTYFVSKTTKTTTFKQEL